MAAIAAGAGALGLVSLMPSVGNDIYEKTGFKRREPFADYRPRPTQRLHGTTTLTRDASRVRPFIVVVRRQIKNAVASVGKNRNPCYELAVADLRPHDSGAEADYRWVHVRSKHEPEECFCLNRL
jgi:hypothetical protein